MIDTLTIEDLFETDEFKGSKIVQNKNVVKYYNSLNEILFTYDNKYNAVWINPANVYDKICKHIELTYSNALEQFKIILEKYFGIKNVMVLMAVET